MSKKALIFIFVFCFVFGYSAYQALKLDKKLSDSSPFNESELIRSAPEVSFVKLGESEKIAFKDILAGQKVVIVHFWATWCVPCIKEFPEFISFSQKFSKTQGLKILAVSVDDKLKDVKKFITEYKISLPSNIDMLEDNMGSHRYFGSYKLPETFIFSGNGKLIRKFSGSQRWNDESFSKFLESLTI